MQLRRAALAAAFLFLATVPGMAFPDRPIRLIVGFAPGVRDRLVAVGVEPAPTSPEKFSAFVRSEIAKWSDVIAKAGPAKTDPAKAGAKAN